MHRFSTRFFVGSLLFFLLLFFFSFFYLETTDNSLYRNLGPLSIYGKQSRDQCYNHCSNIDSVDHAVDGCLRPTGKQRQVIALLLILIR